MELVAKLQAMGVPVSATPLSTSLSVKQRYTLAFQTVTFSTRIWQPISAWNDFSFALRILVFFYYVGDAGNTSLVDVGTPLGATAVVTPGSAGIYFWECCILASL